MLTRDYIMRMVEMMGQAMLRLLRLKEERRYEEARDCLGDVCEEVLGHQMHFLDLLKPARVVDVLGDFTRVKILGRLLQEEADLLREQGDRDGAAGRHRRALEVVVEGLIQGGRRDDEVDELLRRGLREVAPDELSPRVRERLAAVTLD